MGRLLRIIVFVVTALALTGCLSSEPKIAEVEQVAAVQREAMTATEAPEGGGGEGGGEGGPAVFVAVDLGFPEAPSELPAGGAQVELDNQGAIEHNVVIEETDQKILEAPGGGTDSATVDLEPGDYTYFCDIPGHRAAGMEGTLTVAG